MLFLVFGCSDATLSTKLVLTEPEGDSATPTDPDAPPTCVITTPAAEAALPEGPALFTAAVTDDGGVDALALAWTLDGEPAAWCPATTSSEVVSCTLSLGAANLEACVTVTDLAGQSATDCVAFTVTPCTPVTWYRDADRDGYGDPEVSLEACDAPEGYVADDTDCDDTSPGNELGGTQGCAGDSCAAILAARGRVADGLYWIDTDTDGDTSDALQAWCDMTRDDGGWTLDMVGLDDTSNDLHTDTAVGVLDSPSPAASAKLSRAVITELASFGAGEFRYGHDDFGWLYMFDLDPDWIRVGEGGTGYDTFVAPYTSDVVYGGSGHPGSRFAWPAGSVPSVCPNTDGTTTECGAGLHFGTWELIWPDGVYMNYSAIEPRQLLHVHYLLWAR